MRRTRTGPTTTPASGEGPGSSVVMACVGHEREQAAERAAPQLFIWLLAGGVHIGRADGLRRRALRLQERVGYPVAKSPRVPGKGR
jgi:hypothetical protein